MAGYQGLLRSDAQDGDGGIDSSMGPPPIRVRSGSCTLGLRVARSGGGGGAMAGHAVSSSSGGGRGPPLPPVTTGVHAMRGSTSGSVLL
jgi:hypothetical protein